MEFVEVVKRREQMCSSYSNCTKCPLFDAKNENNDTCEEFISENPEEAEKLIMAWKESVDWDIVPTDARIYVRDHIGEEWHRRHFAEYRNGTVYAWTKGCTSWSYDATNFKYGWRYAKLAE